jgi:hypothetical protein
MKLDKKIIISIFDFFKYGKFDCIKLDQTREWILNNFPDPDTTFPNDNFDVWEYGNIEFHFKDNKLFLIFCDTFRICKGIRGGKNISINKWIFNKLDELKLINILKILNENDIDYKKTEDSLNIKLKLESGIEMTFENCDDIENLNKNNFELTSFGLHNMELNYQK